MNLVIDCGNSKIKMAVFDEFSHIVEEIRIESLDVSVLSGLMSKYKYDKCILSSVIDVDKAVLGWLKENVGFFIEFDNNVPVCLNNGYEIPSTLGADRMSAAVGAWIQKAGNPILVIDAGSAITYDYISADGTFQGGSIAPGMQMRFDVLHRNTKHLPLVKPDTNFATIGKTTESAILSGVMQGIVNEIEGYINLYRKKSKTLFVFLTGGDAFYFEKKIKNDIFVFQNLVLLGLNRILNDNVYK